MSNDSLPPVASPPPRVAAADDSQNRHISPWTTRQKLGRALWGIVQSTAFSLSPHNAYYFRRWLLRCFGAKLDADVRVRRSARIAVPWNLTMGRGSVLGDHAIVYCLGPVTMGKFVTISQYAHLCAGTHDGEKRSMRLLRPPITIGDDVWIAADAFVGPGVSIGDRTILGARASAFSDLPPDVIAFGNPAKPVKARIFNPNA